MKEIEDIHTHRWEPEWGAIVNIRFSWPDTDPPLDTLGEGQMYSVGVHPWDASFKTDEEFREEFGKLAASPSVVAIGECGVDLKNTDTPLFRQLQVFRHQIEVSERLGKPVIVHNVKGDDIICGLRRDLKPTQPWVIHGFRGKPAAAQGLLRSGCYISFGERFNPDTVKAMPDDRILAETDESELEISDIIRRLAETRCQTQEELTAIIKANSRKFCNFGV